MRRGPMGSYLARNQGYTPLQRGPQFLRDVIQRDAGQFGVPPTVEDMAARGPFRRVQARMPWVRKTEFDKFIRVFREAFQPRHWDVNIVIAAALGANAGAVQVGTDAWFFVDSLTGNSTGAYTLQIVENESGEQLFPNAIPNVAVVGNANVSGPFYLSIPWMVTGTVQVLATDTSGAANNIDVVLNGYMVYPGRLPDNVTS